MIAEGCDVKIRVNYVVSKIQTIIIVDCSFVTVR